MVNNRVVIWTCEVCGELNYSNPFERHKLTRCPCGASGCDLEREYSRILGGYRFIKEIPFDFYAELAASFIEQHRDRILFIEGNPCIDFFDAKLIEKIRDELIEQYISLNRDNLISGK